jgi:type IV secretion system protein VirB1
VGGKLARQPRNLAEALATARMLEGRGFNFSVGLAQINRHNLARYGLDSYESAFQACPNLQAGSRILAECFGRSGGSWGKSFSCYYSGNFTTGYRHGYVQKIYASMRGAAKPGSEVAPIEVVARPARKSAGTAAQSAPVGQLIAKRAATVVSTRVDGSTTPQGSPSIMSRHMASQSLTPEVAAALGAAASTPQITHADQAFVF